MRLAARHYQPSFGQSFRLHRDPTTCNTQASSNEAAESKYQRNQNMASPNQTIKALLENYRHACEQVWREETASPNLRPIAGKPVSTGQCSATSIALSRVLAAYVEPGSLKLAVGGVYNARTLEPLIPLPVWLLHYKNLFREPLAIDITADQSPDIRHSVIYARPTTLIEQGFIYLPWNVMMADDSKPKTLDRAQLLEKLLNG
jgi:hypothetical protein